MPPISITDPLTLAIPTWYLPSYHGDIRLVATSETSCDVMLTKLTPQEEQAVVQLSALATKKRWTDAVLTPSSSTISLRAPIAKVAKALEKLLKPDKTTITAVLFRDGGMAEIRGSMPDADHQLEAPAAAATDEPVTPEVLPKPRRKREPAAAVSVAAPTRGCPAPDFTQADLRAKAVLRTFLTPEQVSDFNRYNKFLSVGQTTGNHYMITSRHARDELAKYTRTLYDLDRRMPLCVHDWDVPAAEEMLTLHVLLQLPGWERYLDISENNMEAVLATFLEEDPALPIVHGPFTHDIDGQPAGQPLIRPRSVSLALRDAMHRGLV